MAAIAACDYTITQYLPHCRKYSLSYKIYFFKLCPLHMAAIAACDYTITQYLPHCRKYSLSYKIYFLNCIHYIWLPLLHTTIVSHSIYHIVGKSKVQKFSSVC